MDKAKSKPAGLRTDHIAPGRNLRPYGKSSQTPSFDLYTYDAGPMPYGGKSSSKVYAKKFEASAVDREARATMRDRREQIIHARRSKIQRWNDHRDEERKVAEARTSSRANFKKKTRGYDLISLDYDRDMGGAELMQRDKRDARHVAQRGSNVYFQANTYDVVAGRSRRNHASFLPNVYPDKKARNFPMFK